MAKKKYIKVKCAICNKPTVLIPNDYEMGIDVICIPCGQKNGNRTSKIPPPLTVVSQYARIKKGIRKDIHPSYSFRSPTEANFARILEHCECKWSYEERVFTFNGYKNRPHVYIPDFEIKDKSSCILKSGFYEVKGYFKPSDRSKLKRLKKHYPKEAGNFTLVIYRKSDRAAKEFCDKMGFNTMYYDELKKMYEPMIPTWE